MFWKGRKDVRTPMGDDKLFSSVRNAAHNAPVDFDCFAGAVFCLQRETLAAFHVNLLYCDDVQMITLLEATNKMPEFSYEQRFKHVIRLLGEICNSNLDFVERLGTEGGGDMTGPEKMLAHSRSCAAQLWFRTATFGTASMIDKSLGTHAIWKLLETSPPEKVAEYADLFAGTFYAGINCSPFDCDSWETWAGPKA